MDGPIVTASEEALVVAACGEDDTLQAVRTDGDGKVSRVCDAHEPIICGGDELTAAQLDRVDTLCVRHLLLEAAAFICAGVAGVFLSKAFLRYALESEAFGSVLKSVSMLLLTGLVLVLAGAMLEGLLAAHLVGWLAG